MSVCLGWLLLLFGAISPSLWVKAAFLFIKQAVKSASYQPALANAAVINSACLLSLTEDYPEACGLFTEVTDILPIFLGPAFCLSVFDSVCCMYSRSLLLMYLLTLGGYVLIRSSLCKGIPSSQSASYLLLVLILGCCRQSC